MPYTAYTVVSKAPETPIVNSDTESNSSYTTRPDVRNTGPTMRRRDAVPTPSRE